MNKAPGGTIPYIIGMQDDSPFVFCRLWRHGKIQRPTTGCAPAQSLPANPTNWSPKVHTRMPVILPEEHHAKWLGEAENGDLRLLAAESAGSFLGERCDAELHQHLRTPDEAKSGTA
ncbi:MAG: SOS response-associated peptidase family protein [Chthoniobacterales bacterium]